MEAATEADGRNDCTIETLCRAQPGHSSTIYTLGLRPEQEKPSLRRNMMFRVHQVPYRPASAFLSGCHPLESPRPTVCQKTSRVTTVLFTHINCGLFTAPASVLSAPLRGLSPAFFPLGPLRGKKLNPLHLCISVTHSKPEATAALRLA